MARKEEIEFTFASWNINGRSIKPGNRMPENYLKQFFFPHYGKDQSSVIDVVALQEVRKSFYEKLVQANIFSGHKFSLLEGAVGEKGCALFVSSKFEIISKPILLLDKILDHRQMPFSRQTIMVELSNPTSGNLTVCSFHIPNGSNYGIDHGHMKRKSGDEIADWLSLKRARTIFGVDANSPYVDHPDRSGTGLYFSDLFDSDSRKFLGPELSHNLRDVYRNYLDAYPSGMIKMKQKRPNGPLAISHYTYKRDGTPIPHRYDHIYATPDLVVTYAEYHPMDRKVYDDKDKKLSDHAMVVAKLRIT